MISGTPLLKRFLVPETPEALSGLKISSSPHALERGSPIKAISLQIAFFIRLIKKAKNMLGDPGYLLRKFRCSHTRMYTLRHPRMLLSGDLLSMLAHPIHSYQKLRLYQHFVGSPTTTRGGSEATPGPRSVLNCEKAY